MKMLVFWNSVCHPCHRLMFCIRTIVTWTAEGNMFHVHYTKLRSKMLQSPWTQHWCLLCFSVPPVCLADLTQSAWEQRAVGWGAVCLKSHQWRCLQASPCTLLCCRMENQPLSSSTSMEMKTKWTKLPRYSDKDTEEMGWEENIPWIPLIRQGVFAVWIVLL